MNTTNQEYSHTLEIFFVSARIKELSMQFFGTEYEMSQLDLIAQAKIPPETEYEVQVLSAINTLASAIDNPEVYTIISENKEILVYEHQEDNGDF